MADIVTSDIEESVPTCGHIPVPDQVTSSPALPTGQATVDDTSSTPPANDLPLDPSTLDDLKQQFIINLKEIKDRYASFVRCLCKAIKSEGVSIDEFRNYLLDLSAFDPTTFESEEDEKQDKLLKEVRDKLEKADSIDKIFSSLREWASFLNADIFQCIMKEYKISGDSESMKYSEHLWNYLLKHKLSDFSEINPGLRKITAGSELILKVNIERLCAITKVIDLKCTVATIVGLRTSALRLMDIREGCVLVTFLVPGFIPDVLFGNGKTLTASQVEQFQNLSIEWLKCGEYKCGEYKLDFKQPLVRNNGMLAAEGHTYNTTIISEEEKEKYEFEMIRASEQGDVSAVQRSVPIQTLRKKMRTQQNGLHAWMPLLRTCVDIQDKLFQVSKEGKVREVESALKKWNQEHHNINEVNEKCIWNFVEFDRMARLASEMGHSSVVVSLLESGTDIDINYQTELHERSALFFAYENGHQDTVRLLLEYGADANLTDKSGMAPSGLPLKKKGFMQKVKNVVKTKFKNLLKKDLWTLSKDGNYEAINYLLEEGHLDVNMKDRSYKDWTPLHYACKYGHFEIVQLLLKNGADIHAKATNNWTALAIACHFNLVRIANLLLKEGANYNQIIQKNFTPIMIVTSNARQEDMEPLARTLLKYGADLEIADERGWIPLMNASDIERVNLVRLYLEYRADVNRRADKGWTALMSAAKHDAGEIARLLIENEANMELAMIPDPKSRKSALEDDALHVASFMGSANVVKELIDHGSEINKTNADGLTPLMIATNQGNIEVVEGLLKSDALDIDLPHQKTGLPALFIAAKKGYLDIFDILLQHGAKDEVNSISVSEVARLFKKKDQILARLKKFKSIKKTEVSAPEQAAQMEPPKREMTTATSVEAVSVEPVTVEAVSEQAESITAVPTETKSLTQDMESGAELTTTTKTISVLPMDTESVTAAQQSTDSVTAIPQVTGSVVSVQDTDISAVPQTPAAVSQSTESVAAMPQVTEGTIKMVPAHVQVETTEEAPEVKQEAEVQEHPDGETVEGADDTSSLYGDGEEDSSEQKEDQDKRGQREEYLKQLLKTWDLVYKSYTDRMSVFTSNNGSEYSGKGVKPVDIQQHYREQTA